MGKRKKPAARKWSWRRLFGKYDCKVFCIGRNKTGTTTMKKVLSHYGYRVAPQQEGERLIFDLDFEPGPRFWDWVDRYEAFQDAPFSWTEFVPAILERYPDAKFILTVREPDSWFDSLRNHHFSHFGVSEMATKAEIRSRMQANEYVAPGYLYAGHLRQFGHPSDDQLYDRAHYIHNLEYHNALVRKTIPQNQLLEIDITKQTDTSAICAFLGIPKIFVRPIFWANRRG